ncbi:hypothetical protein C8F04DRAFT_1305180 [Mycena alexandri]|uniref:Uncharacterized protein n=1 Tax=Mycena alexandri TaxID=1745969 RepID=A0AAD6WTX7_9AGAR|nr:hypothetical protein C8F04DRAFT_1305180 [Mycena alexandri]
MTTRWPNRPCKGCKVLDRDNIRVKYKYTLNIWSWFGLSHCDTLPLWMKKAIRAMETHGKRCAKNTSEPYPWPDLEPIAAEISNQMTHRGHQHDTIFSDKKLRLHRKLTLNYGATTEILIAKWKPFPRADREFRYRRDQLALSETHRLERAAEARTKRLLNRSISPAPGTATFSNPTSVSFPQTSASWPSTPTISTPSDLTPSPELPPKLLPAFFTPAKNPPRGAATPNPKPSKANVSDDDMAPPKTLDLFRGNGTAEKAHTWLRSLEQSLKWDAEEKEKLYKFEKGLYPGSQAEAWFGALKPGEKNDWVALLLAFETKWPKPRPTQRAQDVVIAEIANNCLARADLGKYVKDEDGVSVLSHVAWAEVNRRLLGELVTGDAAMMLKSTVRGSLPLEFRHLINDTGLDTWEKYLKAVEDIGVDRITDAVEEYTARHTAIDNSVFAFAAANPNATAEQWEANSNAFALRMMRDLGLSHYAPASASTPGPRSTYIPPAARQSQPAMASTPRPFTPAANPRPYQTPSTAVDPRTPWASRVSPDPFGGSTVRPGANVPAEQEETMAEAEMAPAAEAATVARVEEDGAPEGGGEAVSAEEVWRWDELERIARKSMKERVRKAAQLDRRAEQPLPFPGLGYSPPPRTAPKPDTPQPFPIAKTTPASETAAKRKSVNLRRNMQG